MLAVHAKRLELSAYMGDPSRRRVCAKNPLSSTRRQTPCSSNASQIPKTATAGASCALCLGHLGSIEVQASLCSVKCTRLTVCMCPGNKHHRSPLACRRALGPARRGWLQPPDRLHPSLAAGRGAGRNGHRLRPAEIRTGRCSIQLLSMVSLPSPMKRVSACQRLRL